MLQDLHLQGSVQDQRRNLKSLRDVTAPAETDHPYITVVRALGRLLSPAGSWQVWIQDEPKELTGTVSSRSGSYSLLEPEDFHKVHHARIVSDWVDLVVE